MNRYTPLHHTADLTVNRFDHPPHEVHEDPECEVASRWAIAFVRTGTFEIEAKGVRRALRPGSVFLVHPGLMFRCRHGEQCPTDVCTSIGFSDQSVAGFEDAWTQSGWVTRDAATPRLAYVERRMREATRQANVFEIERWAVESLSALRADTMPLDATNARGPYAARKSDLDAVVATCRAIESDPSAKRSIAERAHDVGCTSTHLTNAFRRYTGTSPHQYVIRWRLHAAAECLDTGMSVSDSCYRSGFENLSHFCRLFQRTLGTRPSQWRDAANPEKRRKVQAERASQF